MTRTADMLATDCLREFGEWWEATGCRLPPEEIALQSFVAGYERGGKAGIREMHAEAVRIIGEEISG